MSRGLPGNPHAVEGNSGNCVPDAYVQAQATLALAHEVRTVALILWESHVAAHGVVHGSDAAVEITGRLSL